MDGVLLAPFTEGQLCVAHYPVDEALEDRQFVQRRLGEGITLVVHLRRKFRNIVRVVAQPLKLGDDFVILVKDPRLVGLFYGR